MDWTHDDHWTTQGTHGYRSSLVAELAPLNTVEIAVSYNDLQLKAVFKPWELLTLKLT